MIEPIERGGDAGELADGGLGGGRCAAVDRAVVVGAAGAEAGRSGDDRLAGERAHLGDVVVARGDAGEGSLAHHVDAQRVVGDLTHDVDGARAHVDRVHVVGERLPVPADALGERGAGDVLHAFHQLDEPLAILLAHRREADPAVAHHAGGDAWRLDGAMSSSQET